MFEEYVERLKQLQLDIPKECENVVKRGAIHFRNVAVRFTDAYKKVDTGYYKRNWEGVATETNKNNYAVTCYNGVEYASFLEDGYSIEKKHFVPFPDSEKGNKEKPKSEPLKIEGKVLQRASGSKNAATGSPKWNKLINAIRKKYPDAEGFMAKPRRVTGLKIGRQAVNDLKSWMSNEITVILKRAILKNRKK